MAERACQFQAKLLILVQTYAEVCDVAYLQIEHCIQIEICDEVRFAWIKHIDDQPAHDIGISDQSAVQAEKIDGSGKSSGRSRLTGERDWESRQLESRYAEICLCLESWLNIERDGLRE